MEQIYTPPCPLYKKCGGCQLQTLPYPEQLRRKQGREIALLGKFGHVETILGMDDPTHYRNKVCAAFGLDQKKHIVSGVYQPGSHRIVPVDDCLIEDETADRIIVDIRRMLRDFKIQVFDERSGRGFLRHVLVRRGFQSGELMVVLVAASPIFPTQKPFVKKLLETHPEITTVVLNINDRFGPVVLGEREKVLYGPGTIEDTLCSHRFRISPSSFYQINPVQTEVLYGKAVEFAALTGTETVLDAYCGIGTIGIIAAPHARRVLGVELNEEAVRDARHNISANKLDNIEVMQGDATEFMTGLADRLSDAEAEAEAGVKSGQDLPERFDVLFMDPPRSGATEDFMRAACAISPRKIVYISCSPWSLQRDLAFFTENGYEVKKAIPVDMFPYTGGVETVCLLSKLNSKQHIEINLDMDELDLTDAEKKATYQEIKDYVLEHSGLKVSSLYIAQVKQQCGIIERENYNKPKSEDAKQPQCPLDKEKAIKEALKHFGMI